MPDKQDTRTPEQIEQDGKSNLDKLLDWADDVRNG